MPAGAWKWWGRSVAGLFVLAACLVTLDRLFPPPLSRGDVVSTAIKDRDGELLRAFPVEDGRWRLAASLDDIDPDFIEALILIEDKRFFRHLGVDPLAVSRALIDLGRFGHVTSGASTITMQTARLLEPRPRTVGSKLIEMIRALQIEARLSKREILELYLTLAPYGSNIEGVGSASWAWFGKQPEMLLPDQIALLLALPQAPEARRPDLHPAAAKAAREKILMRLAGLGYLPPDRARDAADERLPARRTDFPERAWHAAQTIKKREAAPSIRSTLNGRLQREAERLVAAVAEEAGDDVQASAIIVSVPDRAVLAAVGSAGRARPGGWIDLTNRARSPGSTLKPFIYALAFDDGLASGATRIADLPARFQTYTPENFDRVFRGEVTVADALQHSLNVPAVRLLDAVGANRFVSVLRHGGASVNLPAQMDMEAGLAVALGGLGMSVRDLAVLYSALGDKGSAKPLAWAPAEAERNQLDPGTQLVSAESAQEVLDILAAAPPPPGRMPAQLTSAAPQISFKTGTSYGFRDAWAAGVGEGVAIVVWVGRPDGVPRPGVTGRAGALPLLFSLFDAAMRERPASLLHERRNGPEAADTPQTLAEFGSFTDQPPTILFPPTDAELWAGQGRPSFVLAASGKKPFRWYVDGEPVPLDQGGASVWHPEAGGFYRVVVVDSLGRSNAARVRVITQ